MTKRKRFTLAQRRAALDAARDENGVPRCAICGEPIDEGEPWAMCHGVGPGDSRSLWAGGSNDEAHVRPGHPACNAAQERRERPGREKADRAAGGRGSQYAKRQRRKERETNGQRPIWPEGQKLQSRSAWPPARKMPSRPMRR